MPRSRARPNPDRLQAQVSEVPASFMLYADMAHPASSSAYRRLGYEPAAEVVRHRFG